MYFTFRKKMTVKVTISAAEYIFCFIFLQILKEKLLFTSVNRCIYETDPPSPEVHIILA